MVSYGYVQGYVWFRPCARDLSGRLPPSRLNGCKSSCKLPIERSLTTLKPSWHLKSYRYHVAYSYACPLAERQPRIYISHAHRGPVHTKASQISPRAPYPATVYACSYSCTLTHSASSRDTHDKPVVHLTPARKGLIRRASKLGCTTFPNILVLISF